MKSKPAGYVIRRIKVFIKRIMRPFVTYTTPMYVIEKINNKKVELRTDGLVYDLIYSPWTADVPSLGYKIQAKFDKLVESMGWSWEAAGGGIIHLYEW